MLWPNKRGHWGTVSRERKKHRGWAELSARAEGWKAPEGTIRLAYTVHPKTRNPIDKDNAIAAMKAYQDGIAAALKVDDSTFEEPTITFAEPRKGGAVIVHVEAM
ncbi:hypothetical protein [Allosphingosinicella flava]|uniref:hypothetical protein n=1 Tax=Allosphingosinicella flava TaxID=2771430 RepID=UPI001A9C435D|nr:hypothetical protein [Sphingosinicella flava]